MATTANLAGIIIQICTRFPRKRPSATHRRLGRVRGQLSRSRHRRGRDHTESDVLKRVGSLLVHLDDGALRPEARTAHQDIAETLRGRSVDNITIVGHTDAQSSAPHNRTRSRERAESVRSHLVEQLDVTSIDVTIRGAGPSEPTTSNETTHGCHQNRQVPFNF